MIQVRVVYIQEDRLEYCCWVTPDVATIMHWSVAKLASFRLLAAIGGTTEKYQSCMLLGGFKI